MSKGLRSRIAKQFPCEPQNAFALSQWVETGYGYNGLHSDVYDLCVRTVEEYKSALISEALKPIADRFRYKIFGSMSPGNFARCIDDIAEMVRKANVGDEP